MPNRHGSSDSYRYGFSGKENDGELKGEGNSYDFGARMLDPRIGRWFAIDPDFKMYPYVTPYSYALSTPIQAKDPNGRFVIVVTGSFNWFFLFAGASYGGGLAIGNDGAAAVAYNQKGLGLGLELSASMNVSLFPTMNTVDDLSGDGTSVEASGAHLGKFGVGYQQSSGHDGVSGSIGAGEGAHISYNTSKTVLAKLTWKEMGDFLNGNDVNGMNNNISKSDRSKMKSLLTSGMNRLLSKVNNQISDNNKIIAKNNTLINRYKESTSEEKNKLSKKVGKAMESNIKASKDNENLTKERNDIIEAKTQLK